MRLVRTMGVGVVLGGSLVVGVALGLFMPDRVAAQGTIPNGTSIGMSTTTGSPCQTPAVGIVAVCFTSSGVKVSVDGAAYTALGGSVGPAGPIGPRGDVGPVGPAGTMPTSFTCTSVVISATGAAFNGCK
jgi:hypothetical protein